MRRRIHGAKNDFHQNQEGDADDTPRPTPPGGTVTTPLDGPHGDGVDPMPVQVSGLNVRFIGEP